MMDEPQFICTFNNGLLTSEIDRIGDLVKNHQNDDPVKLADLIVESLTIGQFSPQWFVFIGKRFYTWSTNASKDIIMCGQFDQRFSVLVFKGPYSSGRQLYAFLFFFLFPYDHS